ncbi:hypothetical protein [Ochrobactrum sp. MYb379]|uniref:hypothetical protein n=1 Tax=Ochrobactrum sp. MYb379 TaxID=2745275 RepID=UPI0030AE2601
MSQKMKALFDQIEEQVRDGVKASIRRENLDCVVLFISFTDAKQRAETHTFRATNFRDCWKAAIEKTVQLVGKSDAVRWLRVDWLENVETLSWKALQKDLNNTKRNYYRYGLSLDKQFRHAFLETELNANAMLYGGGQIQHAVINTNNFLRYAKIRHSLSNVSMNADDIVYKFSTQAVFIDCEENTVHLISGAGRTTGRRTIERMSKDDIYGLIDRGSKFLSTQVDQSGRFIYGWHPCFDRPIKAYNSLRHASTLYAMIEAWSVTRDPLLGDAIERAIAYLTEELIKVVIHQKHDLAFLVDENAEIKLGGNAVCLLALVKYSEVLMTDRYHDILNKLACGILYMQDEDAGKFTHVLNYPELTVKSDFRIIYYDGEAAFGLMKLYSLTGDERWINAVEKSFNYFIAAEHWKAHDHWLSYAVNEITRYRPKSEYFVFGLNNFKDYLDFVENRITTFPTLLELMMAAQEMILRLQTSTKHSHLLESLDLDRFYRALEARAHHLLNGHFWPELAMFYANPWKIKGSFFIRHHAFRIRIDDVEHYLSGLVAFLHYRNSAAAPINPPKDIQNGRYAHDFEIT